MNELSKITYQEWYWLTFIAFAIACVVISVIDKLYRMWKEMSDSRFISDAELNRFAPGCFKMRELEDRPNE